MEPTNLCKDECELSPDTCGFYNVDTDECNKTEEVVTDDNTETPENGDDSISEENNEGTTVESINVEVEPAVTVVENVNGDTANTDAETNEVVAETTQTPVDVDAAPLKKAELYPDHKDDPNYYYDGQSGVYKEKDPNFNYNADGTITQKSANDN